MKVKVVNGLDTVLKAKQKFIEVLEDYNSILEKKTPGYKVEFVEEVKKHKKSGEAYTIRFKGLFWKTPRGKGRFRREGLPVEIADEIPAPPRFELEGLEAIVEGASLILEYNVFKRFKELFKGLKWESLDVNLDVVREVLCLKSLEFVREVEGATGLKVSWIPISKVLNDVASELNMSSKEVVEAILFSRDLGVLKVELGESGELWFNTKSSCVD